jgi:hypothetical protein
MKEQLTEWLVRFGTRDDVTWREIQIAGLGRMDFGFLARKGYLIGDNKPSGIGWRYHLTANGLEYLK